MKSIFSLLLSLACFNAVAQSEWIIINTDDSANYYIRKNSISKSGNYVQMTALTDYRRARSLDGYRPTQSMKKQIEYDCSGRRLRNLNGVTYTDSMGTGDVIDKGDFDQKWLGIVPESIGELQWRIACG